MIWWAIGKVSSLGSPSKTTSFFIVPNHRLIRLKRGKTIHAEDNYSKSLNLNSSLSLSDVDLHSWDGPKPQLTLQSHPHSPYYRLEMVLTGDKQSILNLSPTLNSSLSLMLICTLGMVPSLGLPSRATFSSVVKSSSCLWLILFGTKLSETFIVNELQGIQIMWAFIWEVKHNKLSAIHDIQGLAQVYVFGAWISVVLWEINIVFK